MVSYLCHMMFIVFVFSGKFLKIFEYSLPNFHVRGSISRMSRSLIIYKINDMYGSFLIHWVHHKLKSQKMYLWIAVIPLFAQLHLQIILSLHYEHSLENYKIIVTNENRLKYLLVIWRQHTIILVIRVALTKCISSFYVITS